MESSLLHVCSVGRCYVAKEGMHLLQQILSHCRSIFYHLCCRLDSINQNRVKPAKSTQCLSTQCFSTLNTLSASQHSVVATKRVEIKKPQFDNLFGTGLIRSSRICGHQTPN